MAYITLKRQHFFHNLDIIAKLSKSKDKIALVLKDNAYGHGLCEMASMAAEYGIKRAVVRSYDEARMVAEFFDYILVLADSPKEYSEKIRYTINDIESIAHFAKGTKVELKVNSGMNRNGIEPSELERAFKKIAAKDLVLEAVFTHHACADEADERYYKMQKEAFESIKKRAESLATQYGFAPLRYHSCNSAALFRERDFDEDMARVGIAAYGCLEMPRGVDSESKKLLPVLSLYAKRISQRKLSKYDAVGYGATFKATKASCVSNYDFGYADGFLRSASGSFVTPQGVALAGRISMDNSSFISDEAELLVFDDASSLAKAAKTISYEVLTSLKSYLHRKIV